MAHALVELIVRFAIALSDDNRTSHTTYRIETTAGDALLTPDGREIWAVVSGEMGDGFDATINATNYHKSFKRARTARAAVQQQLEEHIRKGEIAIAADDAPATDTTVAAHKALTQDPDLAEIRRLLNNSTSRASRARKGVKEAVSNWERAQYQKRLDEANAETARLQAQREAIKSA